MMAGDVALPLEISSRLYAQIQHEAKTRLMGVRPLVTAVLTTFCAAAQARRETESNRDDGARHVCCYCRDVTATGEAWCCWCERARAGLRSHPADLAAARPAPRPR